MCEIQCNLRQPVLFSAIVSYRVYGGDLWGKAVNLLCYTAYNAPQSHAQISSQSFDFSENWTI